MGWCAIGGGGGGYSGTNGGATITDSGKFSTDGTIIAKGKLTVAGDVEIGNDIVAKDYLESKPVGDRSLAQGLKGDAT